jgi:hypothetical protein
VTRFHFPLQTVLEWRQTQLDVEEARLRQRLAALAAVDREQSELASFASRTESDVRSWNPVAGSDLSALAGYREHVRAEALRLAGRRAARVREVASQQSAVMEARRRCRLLERLKDRRMAEWKAACDREMDEIAAESYLAQWGNSAPGRL